MNSRSTTAANWKKTACILCECNCGIEIQLGGENGRRFVRTRGDRDHPASRGYVCEKPARLDYYQNGKDRLYRPLRRSPDGGFEEVDWSTAISEVAERFATVRDRYGGESIMYYGGGGQGNHLPAAYARATRAALGSAYRSNALAQEKTGEFWVAANMTGCMTRSDFENCETAVFIGKNPWLSHGIPRARITLREIARDPERCLIVIDPRRSETADIADIHLMPRPGTDAWLLAAIAAVLVQEDLLAADWLEEHTVGMDEILPFFRDLDVPAYCAISGIGEHQVRQASRRIARAESAAFFEDLGVQMNRHSTLVSYLHRILAFGTGNFGKEGTVYSPASLQPIVSGSVSTRKSPVTGSRIISGLLPCNLIPDEILSDHPGRFRAMLVESANPAHSLADSARMREALQALDFLVVIDVAMSETAELADYVLPVASQFEKAEATFFNFEFPSNYFHLRRPLLEPPEGLFSEAELHSRLLEALGLMPGEAVSALRGAWKTGRTAFLACIHELAKQDSRLMAIAPVVLFRAIGDLLPEGTAEGAVVWALAQMASARQADSIRRAGIEGSDSELGDALFDAILAAESGVVFAKDDWDTPWKRLGRPDGRIQMAVPELFDELAALARGETTQADGRFPLVLCAGERRSYTANTIIRNPDWRRKDRAGALRVSPADAENLGLADGDKARLSTRRHSLEVEVEVSDRMQPGHVSLPNGYGLAYPVAGEANETTGISTNELTASEDRDWLAGTPWHKHVPARLEAL
jgi:anaerobic selenocysteine-containing dehydrogenase